MKLTDQTILITGGASGIGLALAEALERKGNQVIVAGRSQSKLEAARAQGFEAFTVDMTDRQSIQSMADDAILRFPRLNCVVHNAGIMVNEKLITGGNASIATDTVLTNLLGPMLLTNALLPHLIRQASASIVTVTSGLAYVPLAMTPSYCATKAGLHSYTESLRYQLKGSNIEVKEIVPPYVRTSLMGDRQANDPNAMPLEAFIDEVMAILENDPQIEEVVVQNSAPFRNAAYEGRDHYRELFQKRNDFFMTARQKEWEQL